MDIDQLRDLINLFEGSSLNEIEIEEEGRRICLRKQPPQQAAAYTLPTAPPALQYAAPPIAHPADAGEPAPAVEPDEHAGLPTINCPMVGTFYASPAPGEPAFVHVGDIVDEDQSVCIVEAMKLMNEVTAKFRAEIVKILVENGEPVEFGQPLFIVRPTDEV